MIYFLMIAASAMILPNSKSANLTRHRAGVITVSRRQRKCIISFLIVFLVAALRYGVGTDYFFTYVPGYIVLRTHPGEYQYYEPLFRILNLICIAITDNYQMIFVTTSLIIYGILFFTIAKWSDNPKESILVYFCSSLFFNSLSNVRQAIAMVLCLLALEVFLDNIALVRMSGRVEKTSKKKFISALIKFYLIVLVAYLFHTSAFIFACVPFLMLIKRLKIRNHIMLACGIAFVALILNSVGIIRQIMNILLQLFARYGWYESDGTIYWSFLILHLAVYILLYVSSLLSTMNSEENTRGNLYLSIQLIATILMMFSNIIPATDRLTKYFLICQCISVPFFLKRIKRQKDKSIIRGLFVLLYVLWIAFYIIKYGADGCFPYQCVLFIKDMWQKSYFGI